MEHSNPRAPARQRLVEAGLEVLETDGLATLMRGLTAKQISSEAHLSERTFYSEFPSKQDFVRSLLDEIANPVRIAEAPNFALELESSLSDARHDTLVRIRSLCDSHFERMAHNPALPIQFAIIGLGYQDEDVMEEMRGLYAELTHELAEAYRAVLNHWGVAIRSPLTLDGVAVVLAALTEGLVLRSLVDPDSTPPSILSDAVLALFPGTVDFANSGLVLEEFIGSPDRGEELPTDSINIDLLQRLTAVGRENLSDRQGLAALRLEQVAADSGESLETVKRLFPSTYSLVTAVSRPVVFTLRDSVAGDLSLGFDHAELIVRHFTRLATLFIRMPALAELVILSCAGTNPEATRMVEELDFGGLVIEYLEAAIEEGTIDGSQEPAAHARMLTNMTAVCANQTDETERIQAVERMIRRQLSISTQ